MSMFLTHRLTCTFDLVEIQSTHHSWVGWDTRGGIFHKLCTQFRTVMCRSLQN